MLDVKVSEFKGGEGTQEVIAAGLGSSSFSSFRSSLFHESMGDYGKPG